MPFRCLRSMRSTRWPSSRPPRPSGWATKPSDGNRMKIKTYQAPTMQEALRAVKAELGPDAVILSTKQLSQGKAQFGLMGGVMVEVTAAIDMDHRPLDTPPEVLPRASSASDQRDELRREVPRFEDVLRSSMMRPTTPDMR